MSIPHVITLIVILAAIIALWIAAIASILRQAVMRPAFKAIWIALCIVLPVLGSLAWFVAGRYWITNRP
jgi:hypothetical protein